MKNIDYKQLDNAVGTIYIEDLLKRAEGGDTISANDALMTIGHYLHSKNLNPENGEILPVPICIRDYLSKAFYAMANGESADKALHLKRSGRRNQNYSATLSVAYMVYQAVHENGKTVLNATIDVADEISKKSQNNELPGYMSSFNDKKVDSASVQDWYYKHLDELKFKHARFEIKPDL